MAHKRIPQLDGIRAVAISAVLVHHLLHVKLLWMGVDLFFVLSGFLITGVLLDRRDRGLKEYFGHFYGRRARRILPPYLLLLLVTTIFFGASWARHWYLYFFGMNVITAFGFSQPITLCVLWSLSVEEQFYFAWPFVVYFLDDKTIAWTAGGLMLAAPLLRWLCTPLFSSHFAIYALTPFRMDTLAAGALLAIIWRRRPYLIARFGRYGLALSGLALGVLALLARNPRFFTFANTRESNVLIYEMTLVISVGVMLWALSGKRVGVLMLSPARYLGRISYTVYLVHLTVYAIASSYLDNQAMALLVTGVGTLIYAAVSWVVLERPLLTATPQPEPEPAYVLEAAA